MLLAVLMVVTMFNGLTVTASAAAATVSYTLKPGDVVINVCKDLGINFYVNMNWIMRANNITSFNTLKAGRTLILPAPGTAPSLNDLPNASGTTGGTTGGTAQAPATGTGTATGALLNGDYVYEYLVYHTMVAGDTIGALCNAFGVDFAQNSDRIMKINNIKSYNRIPVGKTVLLPCTALPQSGSCLRVVAHKIVSGDTTYGICNSYGINYNANAALLKALNNKDNLAAIKAGQILYVPVPATITNGQIAQPGQAGGNNNNKPADKDETSYTITANTTNSYYGSYTVSASSAKAGATVTIKATPKTNYAFGSVKVTDAKGVAVKVSYGDNSASFTMPASNVTVDVVFVSATQFAIKRDKAANGTFETHVNGKAVDKAAEGQAVTIVPIPAYGYQMDSFKVLYGKDNANVWASSSTGDVFTMPGSDVLVQVTFKQMKDTVYQVKANSTENGSFTLTRNGTNVADQYVSAGDIIKITTTPDAGYEVDRIILRYNGEDHYISGDSFTMPRDNVEVTVTFTNTIYKITASAAENGSYEVLNYSDGNKPASTAKVGENIWIVPKPAEGYALKSITVTSAGGQAQFVNKNNVFAMPADSVTIKVEFEKATYYVTTRGAYPYSVKVNGGEAVKVTEVKDIAAHMGDKIEILPGEGKKFASVTAGGDTVSAQVTVTESSATFTMPNGSVGVDVTYK